MKFYTTLILFFFYAFIFRAEARVTDLTDSISDVKIENQQIIFDTKVLGIVRKLKVHRNTSKTENYTYQIFEKKGKLIAEYEMEISSNEKKTKEGILSAQIKTLKDNVVHNGNNFLDYHMKPSKNNVERILQLDKVIKYLLTYKYL
ncbi:hypothetical protein [Pedobacter arcticus]|uniref:hypothetical protein n=1 Tax=Pedobacter arcticus TaxID=752140 RepID=UPI0002E36D11|nr:hypothetical protein [Pedobacter arcticus]